MGTALVFATGYFPRAPLNGEHAASGVQDDVRWKSSRLSFAMIRKIDLGKHNLKAYSAYL